MEGVLAGEDVVAEGVELRDGGVSGGGGDEATFGVFPGSLATRTLVLYQYVGCPHLVRRHFHLLCLSRFFTNE